MSALETIRAKLNSLSVFTTDLSDLVRGIRANKKNPSKYISDQIQQIREELKTDDIMKKANAVQKLTYLQMLGYDMEWASFNVIEVMCCPRFTVKRIGYLAASQSFNEKTEVLVLCANLMRKDFGTKNMYNAAISLNCISNVCNLDLARDIAADVLTMLSSSKPYLRKRAILALYKIFVCFPDSLRPSFPRLRERLQDPDPAVVGSAVNVICELARKNPRNYISLAPTFFELLKANSHNNWMLIKVIKLFGALAPIEQRLARLLVEPMHTLINSTPATSLLYECINTCIAGLAAHLPTMKLCIGKLRSFIEDPDQNLKYLGLVALGNIMRVHPKAVAEHGDVILGCLEDEDATIRARALDLLSGIINRKNMRSVVERLVALLPAAADASFRDDLLAKIIELCHSNQYQYIVDFEWYLSILVEMARVPGLHTCAQISAQLTDVAIRVMVVRPYAARLMIAALRDPRFTASPAAGGACEVLNAAAWIVGEFYREAVCEVAPEELIELLLQPRIASLPAGIQATFMQSVLKVFAKMAAGSEALKVPSDEEEDDEDEDEPVHVDPATPEELQAAVSALLAGLPVFTQSTHIEVQERACIACEMVKLYKDCATRGVDIGPQLFVLFDEALLPVSKAAQKKVPVPEGLDLDTPIYEEEPEDDGEDAEDDKDGIFGGGANADDMEELRRLGDDYATPQQAQSPVRRKKRVSDSPYILGGGDDDEDDGNSKGKEDVDNIPVEKITEDFGELKIGSGRSRSALRGGGKGGAKRKPKVYKVMKVEEEGDDDKDAEAAAREKKKAADGLANISLDEPLRPDESLPVAHHRVVTNSPKARPGAKKQQQQHQKASSSSPAAAAAKKEAAHHKGGVGGSGPAHHGAKRLCADGNLGVAYELKTNPREPTKVMALIKFTNRSKTAEVSGVELTVPDTPAVQIAHVARVEKPSFVVKPGQSVLHQALFTFPAASAASGMTAKGQIKYSMGSAASAEKTSLDFELAIPASTFITPVAISKEELAAIIKSAGAALHVATVPVKVQDPAQASPIAVAIAQGLLHLEPVAGTAGRHVYYGKTIKGAHVAVLIRDKAAASGIIQVELKCGGDEALVKALTAEINAFPLP